MFHRSLPRRPGAAVTVSGLAALALLAGACGSDAASGGVEATGAWARTSPMMADAGAAYMTLSSDEAVTIVSASVPAEIAGMTEIHETVPMDAHDDSMSDDSMSDDAMSDDESMSEDSGMADMAMMMQPVDSLEIPAGGQVTLAPGGLHVMLLELVAPLESGDTFDITFTEDDGDEFTVTVEVRDEAP